MSADPPRAEADPESPSRGSAWSFALTLAIAFAGGALGHAVHMPLPWVIGPMLAVAALALASGRERRQPAAARKAAQCVIGTALGLLFTPAVLGQVAGLAPWIVLGAAFSLALSWLAAPLIQRLARMDGPTAIYSVAIGASAEMALQAYRAGADGASVASSHAVRIILVTSTASAVAWSFGQPVSAADAVAPVLPWANVLPVLVVAVLCALLLARLRLPNPWMLASIIAGAVFASNGLTGRMPDVPLVIAQVLIGWTLGQSITREFFARAPRVLLSAAVVTVGFLLACGALAMLMAWQTGLSQMTALIALAPGGVAEMGVIAKAFGLAAPVVTSFHIVRIVSTIFLTQPLARWMLSTGWVRP